MPIKNKPIALEEPSSRVRIYFPNGSSQLRIGGSRSWRNNNPGNLRAGSFSNGHGSIGSAGGFAVFSDEVTGRADSVALLRTSSYGALTINQTIARRSPPNENDTARLQRDIQNIGGFSGQEILDSLSDAQLERLVDAIKRTEGWLSGTIQQITSP